MERRLELRLEAMLEECEVPPRVFEELARQVGQELGEDNTVIVFDPSAFPKQGRQSVGVNRQWCGRLGNPTAPISVVQHSA